MFKNSTDIW